MYSGRGSGVRIHADAPPDAFRRGGDSLPMSRRTPLTRPGRRLPDRSSGFMPRGVGSVAPATGIQARCYAAEPKRVGSEPTRRGSFWVASFPRGGSKHPALKRVRGFFPVEVPAPRDANTPWGPPPTRQPAGCLAGSCGGSPATG